MSKTIGLGFVIGAALAPSVNASFKTLSQRTQDVGRALKAARLGSELTGDLVRYKNELDALRARQAKAGYANTDLNRKIAETQRLFGAAAAKAREHGIQVGDCARQYRHFTTAVAQSERSLARMQARQNNRAIRSEAGSEILGTVGMAASVVAPIGKAMQFESAMADVKKVVDFETPEQFQAMGRDILLLSTRIPMAASGLGSIMAAAGQSGIARAELLAFTENAAKMGVAFDLTGEQSGEMMANWRAAMGLTQGRVVLLADAVNHLSNNMNAKAGALGEVVQRVGALGMASGLSETQVASLGAALLSSGASPEIASTALKNYVGALTKGTAATQKQQEAFASLGFDARQLAADMQRDAKGTILKVMQALGDAPAEMRGALVSEMFGDESKSAIMPLLQNLGNLRQAFDLTADAGRYAGSMQREYEERAKTSANGLQLLMNQATRLAVTVGSVFLPALNTTFGVVGGFVGALVEGAEKVPWLTETIGGAAVALVGLKVASLAARYGFSVLSDGWQVGKGIIDFFRPSVLAMNLELVKSRAVALGTAAAQKAQATSTWILGAAQKAWALGTRLVVGAQLALNTALAANPIGFVIAGVLALGAAVWAIYTYWEPITAFLGSVWETIKGVFTSGLSAVWNLVTSFNLFEAGAKVLGTLVEGLKSQAGAVYDTIAGAFGKAWKLFAHSDADEGPFSRLTASGRAIPETLGAGIRSAGASPMTAPLGTAFGEALASASPPSSGAPSGLGAPLPPASGSQIQLTYAPTINLPSGAPAQAAAETRRVLDLDRRELEAMLRRMLWDGQRVSYA